MFIRSLSFVVVAAVVSTFAAGCSSETDDKVTLTGKVGGASSVAPKAFGGLALENGAAGLHVVAHKLHRRGEVRAACAISLSGLGCVAAYGQIRFRQHQNRSLSR